jgi:hypothetical protein
MYVIRLWIKNLSIERKSISQLVPLLLQQVVKPKEVTLEVQY